MALAVISSYSSPLPFISCVIFYHVILVAEEIGEVSLSFAQALSPYAFRLGVSLGAVLVSGCLLSSLCSSAKALCSFLTAVTSLPNYPGPVFIIIINLWKLQRALRRKSHVPFHSSLQDWSIGKYFIKERPILKNERRRHEREDSPGHRRLQRAKKFQQDVTLESSIVRSSFRSFLVSYE